MMFYVQIINIVFGSSNSKHRHVVDVVLRTIHATPNIIGYKGVGLRLYWNDCLW